MLCGFKIKPAHGKKKLLLSRQGQESLFHWLWKSTQDHSFIFNTTQGLYLFLSKEHCTSLMEKQLDDYLQGNISEDYILYNCSVEPHYFMHEVGRVLQDEKTSTNKKNAENFQWDKILGTDVISEEYLEGCFQLGQQYPDLCSSIFLMCEKGK